MRALNIVLLVTMFHAPAFADDSKTPVPSSLHKKVVDCRAIGTAEERLACYDREDAALDTAITAKRVAVVDSEQVNEARRSLFGLRLPSLRLFGGDGDREEIKQIDGIIASVHRQGGGAFAFTLQDGAYWVQTDDRFVAEAVKPGSKVTLKKGTLGSYFADFEKSVTVKVKRQN